MAKQSASSKTKSQKGKITIDAGEYERLKEVGKAQTRAASKAAQKTFLERQHQENLKYTADTLEEEDEGEDAPLPPSQKRRHRREVVDDQDEENDSNMVQTPPLTQYRSWRLIDHKDENRGGDDNTDTEEFMNIVRGDSEQEEEDDGNHSQMQGRKDAQQAGNIGESTSTPSCLPSAALSIQPSSRTSSTAMASVSSSSAMTRKCKPTPALFPPSLAQLAIEAHTHICLHIATNEGFPASNICSDISSQIITQSSKISNSFESKLREVEENEALEIFIMDYVWSAGPQIRGEVVAKARLITNSAYGIPGDMSPEEIKLAVECALRAYNSGGKSLQDFSENMFKARWGFYFEKLSTLQKCCPGWMTQMRNNLYKSILQSANFQYLNQKPQDKDYGIDFDALEETMVA
ncbi:hypothetical protein SERLA73DRAFT_69993 [Serpula lacrymans var. lacrymans S7.3]|uniref:Uncharacterized protein n=2 Tax=Serpula lacrymans var. lacrymans TaxID=341189 RepID=F8PLK6_SERL3|nr:uncharacterized protein SERLADRAFT_434075 [Serpula lacrymans var. lacrymans S7.9]EGO02488.1 hypothetical protein SERLA73DRAFT_69993 [Serpula lacrymans var. lacrymans S7.3]EGO28204.1 hypothetical protein SERLADRAFT_434075 [Serpula lacrymans var. lacrymans S7.9]